MINQDRYENELKQLFNVLHGTWRLYPATQRHDIYYYAPKYHFDKSNYEYFHESNFEHKPILFFKENMKTIPGFTHEGCFKVIDIKNELK